MIGKIVTKALFNFRNLGVLIILLGAGMALTEENNTLIGNYTRLIALGVPVGVYAALVAQSLTSKKFQDKVLSREKEKSIKELDSECMSLSHEAKKCLSAAHYPRLKKVMDDRKDIVDSFFKGERGFMKEKIVEQTLNLVISYLKLLANFSKRSKELTNTDVTVIANRVTENNYKLRYTNDPRVAEDIKRAIEMDEKIIIRIKEEKLDLERISAKLNYMESMVNMFKQQILSSIESEDMLEKLETAVNEATALDNVLDERRRNKFSI